MMKTSTSLKIVQGSRITSTGPSPISLKNGEIVEGKILERLSSNTILIQLKNKQVEARTEIPLKVGETFQFKVETTEGEIRLKRLPNATNLAYANKILMKALQGLKGLPLTVADFNGLLTQLNHLPESIGHLLPDMSILFHYLKEKDEITGKKLKALIESSGIFFETKLRKRLLQSLLDEDDEQRIGEAFKKSIETDLKGMFLKLRKTLMEKSVLTQLQKEGVETSRLIDSIDNLIDKLTHQQAQAKLNHAIQIFLPFFWKGLNDGSLIFRESEKEQTAHSDKLSFSCTIHLQLEKVGRLTTHVQMHSGQFYVRFISEHPGFVKRIQTQMMTLKEQFKAVGLKCGDLSVSFQKVVHFDHVVSDGIDIKI